MGSDEERPINVSVYGRATNEPYYSPAAQCVCVCGGGVGGWGRHLDPQEGDTVSRLVFLRPVNRYSYIRAIGDTVRA